MWRNSQDRSVEEEKEKMSVYRDTDVLKLEERIKDLENYITKLK